MQRCTQCGENILRPRVSLDFSSLNDRLRSQSGPLSVQPEEVTTILKNIELDEEDCEAEINRLETRALLLATQKERLREYANRVQALISPIRKLPDELLRKIFDLSCGMNHFVVDDIPPKNAFSFGSAPSMAISSVCSRWRKNALAMPMIWSRISLEWDAVGADSWEELKESSFPLFLALTRSLLQPLSVELAISGQPFLRHDCVHPIILKLIETRSRWHKFTLHTLSSTFKELFSNTTSCKFPLLEHLCLRDALSHKLTFWMEHAPNLKKLKTCGTIPEPNAFPKITQIEFQPRANHLENFVKANQNISSLTLDEYVLPETFQPFIPRPRICSRMETLLVRYKPERGDSKPSSSVFSSLHCPLLKNLYFEPRDAKVCYSWEGLDSFMNFVQRSSFPLTTLSLQNLALSDSNLVDLLRHLPTLVNLIVDDKMLTKLNPLTEQFTSSLHAYRPSPLRSNTSPIVPRLQSLTLSCGASTFNDAAIVDMVRSRWIPSARLGSSSVAETSYMSPLQVDCLREFTMEFRARTKENNVVYMPLERLEKNGLRAVVLWGQK